MNHKVGPVVLRQPEPKDIEALYQQKNDPEVANLLGGFSTGYSRAALADWIEHHRARRDEIIWAIADEDDRCLGHVGLYNIDYRIRKAEFAIMLGDKGSWGKGIGKQVTWFAVQYGFEMLNLNRVELTVIAPNVRARKLYEKLGFREEGVLRQAQFKQDGYVDVVWMSILRSEYESRES